MPVKTPFRKSLSLSLSELHKADWLHNRTGLGEKVCLIRSERWEREGEKGPQRVTRAAISGRLRVPLPGVAVLSSASCFLSWYHHTLHPSHYLSLLIKFPLRSKKPEFLAPTGWKEGRRSHHRLPKGFQDEMRHEFQPMTYKSPKSEAPHLAFIYLLFLTGRPTPDLCGLGLNYVLEWPYLQPSYTDWAVTSTDLVSVLRTPWYTVELKVLKT